VLCALVPSACGPLTTILGVLGLGRPAALGPNPGTTVTTVEPIDRTLGGLVAVN
jgi:phospholipid/cholesterol/gamma-HCH transport system substrate-binding protein